MIQEILTYIIVASAFLFAGYKILLVFIPSSNKKQSFQGIKPINSNGCDSCSGDCAIREMNFENKLNQVPFHK